MRPIPGTERRFECDTLMLSIGLIPNNDLLDNIGVSVSSTRGSKVNEHMETEIPGVFSCGNVLHVHDLVDYVVEEGKVAGLGAAKYLQGQLPTHENVLYTKAGEGIGYVVPSCIDLANAEDKVQLKFRVRKPRKDVYVEYRLGDKVLRRMLKPAIIPSEMEIISLDKKLLEGEGELTVSLVEKEAK